MKLRLYPIKLCAIYVIVGLITLACLLMNGPMRGGLPLDTSLAERMVFIAEHRQIWILSWLAWVFLY